MSTWHISNKGQPAGSSRGLKEFDLWTSKYSADWGLQASPHIKPRDSWKDRGRIAISMAASCHTMLIPGREDNFLFYMGGVHTARSDGACVSLSLSLTDGWLPDITHSVRRPLILNITALTLLFIYCLYKPRHFFSRSKRRPTCKSLLKLQPRNERKWP